MWPYLYHWICPSYTLILLLNFFLKLVSSVYLYLVFMVFKKSLGFSIHIYILIFYHKSVSFFFLFLLIELPLTDLHVSGAMEH